MKINAMENFSDTREFFRQNKNLKNHLDDGYQI